MPKRPNPELIDDENPEWTDADFSRARPAAEVLPELFGAKRQASEALHTMWANAPAEDLTPEIEQMIDEQVQAIRAQRRGQAAT